MVRSRSALVLTLGLASACASVRGPGAAAPASAPAEEQGARRVEMEPVRIQSKPDPLVGLDTFDAGDLLEKANAHFDQKDFVIAAKIYERLITAFPESSLVSSALYNQGLALEQLEQFADGAERFERVIREHPTSASAKDAYYRLSVCYSKLGRWKEVADTFWAVRQRGELTAMDELEARVGLGIAMFMMSDYATAEKEFMSAVRFYEEKSKEQFLPATYWVAQARFYLGEIYAREFETMKLTAPEGLAGDQWTEAMARQLEDKCQRLLRSQNMLIRAIRVGHTGWATAAGYRIGSLYEKLHDDLTNVPEPPGLGDEAKQYYHEELHRRIAVLVSKAVQIYERSLDMAERVGEKNEWVEKTAQSLERMKALALKSLRDE